jgi:hypothetical protein
MNVCTCRGSQTIDTICPSPTVAYRLKYSRRVSNNVSRIERAEFWRCCIVNDSNETALHFSTALSLSCLTLFWLSGRCLHNIKWMHVLLEALMLLCCSLCTESYPHAISWGAIFVDEYFDEPVIRFLAILFYVCTTNFSTSGGKAVIFHELDSTVKQVSVLTSVTVQIRSLSGEFIFQCLSPPSPQWYLLSIRFVSPYRMNSEPHTGVGCRLHWSFTALESAKYTWNQTKRKVHELYMSR